MTPRLLLRPSLPLWFLLSLFAFTHVESCTPTTLPPQESPGGESGLRVEGDEREPSTLPGEGKADSMGPEPRSSEPQKPPDASPPSDLPPGQCRKDGDCQFFQVCDVQRGRCYSNCTTGASCLDGDRCNPQKRRCVCDAKACQASGGFCHGLTDLCSSSCDEDAACPQGKRCVGSRCVAAGPHDGGPPTERTPRLKEGDDCSKGPCEVGLQCVKTNEGPEICLRTCVKDSLCKNGAQCSPPILANKLGVCGVLVAEDAACSTAKRLLCAHGFTCKSGTCQRRNRVPYFSQCDDQHLCVTPASAPNARVTCASFGADYGSLCLKECKVGATGGCASGQECFSPNGTSDGVCVVPCQGANPSCPNPYLRCNSVGAKTICTPQGKATENGAGDPCGGPYGTCAAPSTCQVIFRASKIGLCAEACKAGTCTAGWACLAAYAGDPKRCFKSCPGFGAPCPSGLICTPVGGQWICAP